ncbi:MAG: hypothetical protein DYH03_06475 [Nitrospira sp. NTP1]|nr:hypothetical protein [Nitrospira sp. NTP1]
MPTTIQRTHPLLASALTVLFLMGLLPEARAGEFRSDNPLNQPGKIYWCPNRTADKRITATPDAGCTALYDAERDQKKPASSSQNEPNDSAAKEPLKILDIQNEASKFTRDYREFLDCCASEWDSLDRIDELLEAAPASLQNSAPLPDNGRSAKLWAPLPLREMTSKNSEPA